MSSSNASIAPISHGRSILPSSTVVGLAAIVEQDIILDDDIIGHSDQSGWPDHLHRRLPTSSARSRRSPTTSPPRYSAAAAGKGKLSPFPASHRNGQMTNCKPRVTDSSHIAFHGNFMLFLSSRFAMTITVTETEDMVPLPHWSQAVHLKPEFLIISITPSDGLRHTQPSERSHVNRTLDSTRRCRNTRAQGTFTHSIGTRHGRMACAPSSSTTSASTLDVMASTPGPGLWDENIQSSSAPALPPTFQTGTKLEKLRRATIPSQKAIRWRHDKDRQGQEEVKAAC